MVETALYFRSAAMIAMFDASECGRLSGFLASRGMSAQQTIRIAFPERRSSTATVLITSEKATKARRHGLSLFWGLTQNFVT